MQAQNLNFSGVDRVYVDAVFVIAAYVPGSSQKRQADILWTRLVASGVKICISTLLLDELWHKAIQMFYRRDNPGMQWPQSDPTLPQKYYPELSEMTRRLLNLPNVELLSMPADVRPMIDDALSLTEHASLYPRDAFHLALARAHNVQYAVSNDTQWQHEYITRPIVLKF